MSDDNDSKNMDTENPAVGGYIKPGKLYLPIADNFIPYESDSPARENCDGGNVSITISIDTFPDMRQAIRERMREIGIRAYKHGAEARHDFEKGASALNSPPEGVDGDE